MVEIGEKELKNEAFFKRIINTKIPVILLINKIDTSTPRRGRIKNSVLEK